ncbi:hypothetical protein MBLNU457_6523t1 [Dothideomycetes sp. NU457]
MSSSVSPNSSYRITAKLPNELIMKVAENLHYKDVRNLLKTIADDRVEKHLAEAGLSADRLSELPEALRKRSLLEANLQTLVDVKRSQQIREEWDAETKRLEEEEAYIKEHPYLRRYTWKDVNYKPPRMNPRGYYSRGYYY